MTPDELRRSVLELMAQNRKIEAVKLYRDVTHLGLAEAKAGVEAIAANMPVAIPVGPSPSSNPSDAIAEHLRAGRKIDAIKVYREQTGLGLAEAKAAIEAMVAGTPVPTALSHPTGATSVDLDTALVGVEPLIRGGNRIGAIKEVRERTGLGLAEAKSAVEMYELKLKRGMVPERPPERPVVSGPAMPVFPPSATASNASSPFGLPQVTRTRQGFGSDDLARTNPLPSGPGMAIVLVLLVTTVLGLVFFMFGR